MTNIKVLTVLLVAASAVALTIVPSSAARHQATSTYVEQAAVHSAQREYLPPCREAKFLGDFNHLKHYLVCHGIRYSTVFSDGGSPPVLAQPQKQPKRKGIYPATGFRQLTGGPACQWTAFHVQKACFHGGTGHNCKNNVCVTFVCAKWYADGSTSWPYHCGPLEHYNMNHEQTLWDWLIPRAKTALGACAKASIPGVIGGIIVKIAGHGWLGMIAGVSGGCIGGLANAKYST